MLPINDIEESLKEVSNSIESVTHRFDHLKRTAIGSSWFVKILGGDEKEEDMAYVSGLLHDLVRPPSDKIEHSEDATSAAGLFLNKFNLEAGDKERILLAVKEHRGELKKDILQESLFLSDKILEQMGAFIVFRRCIFLGETKDYEGKPLNYAVRSQFTKRLKKFSPEKFPLRFSRLANYQYGWPKKFLEAFEKGERWAINIAEQCYEAGKNKADIIKTISNFKTVSGEDKKYKEETLEYLEGKKFNYFKKLLN